MRITTSGVRVIRIEAHRAYIVWNNMVKRVNPAGLLSAAALWCAVGVLR